MLRLDLHLHSTFSDGTLPPEKLVRLLKSRRVSVAALTDHDTVDGAGEFLAHCGRQGIRGVAGVELSAAHDGVLHILGYRLDTENGAMRRALARIRETRESRNLLICGKLRELGFAVTLEEARAKAGSDVVGRPHIARVLWEKGYVPNVRAAFERYLGQGAEAYVCLPLPSAEQCVQLIRGAGGLPVLAHPSQTAPLLDGLPPVLARLKDAGLWGLECWFPGNGPADVYRCLEMAAAFELCPTGGSDFHGGDRSSAGVGVSVGEDILPWAHLCGGL